MLCRLLILRHAKSSQPEIGMSDHERPLNEKGSNDAIKMGEKIAAHYKPKLVICSDSRRTMETWAGMSSLFSEFEFHKSNVLYCSDIDSHLGYMSNFAFEGKTMLIIGHNPTMEELVYVLSQKRIVMKPAHLAVLEIHSDSWAEALSAKGLWQLAEVITP